MINKKKTGRVIFFFLFAVIFLFVLAGSAYIYLTNVSDMLEVQTKRSLQEMSTQNSLLIREKINKNISTLQAMATFIGKYDNLYCDEVMDSINVEAGRNSFDRIALVDLNGNAVTNDGEKFNASESSYFKSILNGKNAVSDAMTIQISDSDVIVYGIPVYHDNVLSGGVLGIHNVYEYTKTLLSKSFGGAGYSYIMKSTGEAVSALYRDSVGIEFSRYIGFKDSQSFKSIPELSRLPNEMLWGKIGIMKYELNGIEKYLYYAPISINDWYILSVVPKSEISSQASQIMEWTLILCAIVLCFLGMFFVYILILKNKNQKELTKLAYYDNLTKIPNWTKMCVDGPKVIKAEGKFALVVFDVNKFKLVNDMYGYGFGNNILQHIADTIKEFVGPKELAARLSGDEFALLLNYTDNRSMVMIMKALFKQIANSNNIGSESISYKLTFSCGVCVISPDGHMTITGACDRAKMAKKMIKGLFEDNVAFYDAQIKKNMLDEQEIENCMNKAIENREFEVYLQPQYRLNDEHISGAEALVRWNNEKRGFMQPMSFIPIFEKNGFIVKLDYYVFDEVCRKLSQWRDEGKHSVAVAVNMSRLHIHEIDFIEKLVHITEKYDISPSMLEIELTETVFLDNSDKIVSVMEKLKDVGFKLSMDDFGSGYSSLNLLTEIPVDIIKLDRDFFRSFETNDRGRKVVSTIIQLAQDLDMKVVAEGVETVDQVTFLKEISCDMVQGYYYARPMKISQFEDLAFVEENRTEKEEIVEINTN